jgi:hypothetical protein
MHLYSMEYIANWVIVGVVYTVCALPLLREFIEVGHSPPEWWLRWFSWADWYYGSDGNWHPLPGLGEKVIIGCWHLLDAYLDEAADNSAGEILKFIGNIIGTLPPWAANIATGLWTLFYRVGDAAVIWADSATDAVNRLYAWLPVEIKMAGLSWASLFDNAVNQAKAWALLFYASTVIRAFGAYDWIATQGLILVTWFNDHAGWLVDLQVNFTARVVAQLGATWTWLVSFKLNPKAVVDALYGAGLGMAIKIANDAGTWLYALWSNYHSELSAFLSDPGGWIVARAAEEVDRLW